jgi:hypothetical protein
MKSLEQKVVELIDGAQKLAEPAFAVTLRAVQIGALLDLILSIAFLVMLFYAARWALRHRDRWPEDSFAVEFGGAFMLIALAVCVTLCLITIFAPSTYLAIFDPKLALAYRLIH